MRSGTAAGTSHQNHLEISPPILITGRQRRRTGIDHQPHHILGPAQTIPQIRTAGRTGSHTVIIQRNHYASTPQTLTVDVQGSHAVTQQSIHPTSPPRFPMEINQRSRTGTDQRRPGKLPRIPTLGWQSDLTERHHNLLTRMMTAARGRRSGATVTAHLTQPAASASAA